MACECNYDWCAWPNITGTSDNLCPHHSHRLAIEYKRLQAIVDKLPKCWRLDEGGKLVQDVPLMLEMKVYVPSRKSRAIPYFYVSQISIGTVWLDHWPATAREVRPQQCYSTREAAEAAGGDDG